MILTELYENSSVLDRLSSALEGGENAGARVKIDGLAGSLAPVLAAALAPRIPTSSQIMIAPTKEDAYYLAGDLEAIINEECGMRNEESTDTPTNSSVLTPHSSLSVLLFPTSYRKAYNYDPEQTENSNVIMRGEVVKTLASGERCIVVTYPDALAEKVPAPKVLADSTLRLVRGMEMELDSLIDRLQELGFDRVDFVVEGGQFAVRGGIVDIYSLASENPYRIEFFDNEIDSLRTFDAATQLSVKQLDRVDIVGKVDRGERKEESDDDAPQSSSQVSLLAYFSSADILWVQGLMQAAERMETLLGDTRRAYNDRLADKEHTIVGTLPQPEEMSCSANEFIKELLRLRVVEHGNNRYFSQATRIEVHSEPQPAFGKRFDMLTADLSEHVDNGYRILITVSNESQRKRLEKILGGESEKWKVESDAAAPGQLPSLSLPLSNSKPGVRLFNRHISRRTHQAHLLIGCEAPDIFSQQKTAFTLLNNILGGPAMNSRLNVAIRERYGFCYTIESQYVPFSDTGLFYIYAGVDLDAEERVIDLIKTELRRIAETPLTPRQLRTAQQQFIGQMAINNDNGLNEMQSIGKACLSFEHVDTIEEMNADIMRVTADELASIAAQRFKPDTLSTLVYGR